jgi:hypothetical protein
LDTRTLDNEVEFIAEMEKQRGEIESKLTQIMNLFVVAAIEPVADFRFGIKENSAP